MNQHLNSLLCILYMYCFVCLLYLVLLWFALMPSWSDQSFVITNKVLFCSVLFSGHGKAYGMASWYVRHGVVTIYLYVFTWGGMVWYMGCPGWHGKVYGMAWWAWHGIWNGLVGMGKCMAWQTCHSIWYGQIMHGMVYGMAWWAWHGIWYGLAGICYRVWSGEA